MVFLRRPRVARASTPRHAAAARTRICRAPAPAGVRCVSSGFGHKAESKQNRRGFLSAATAAMRVLARRHTDSGGMACWQRLAAATTANDTA
jgi:hypothetical protein